MISKIHTLDDITRAQKTPTDPNAVSAAFNQIKEIIKDFERQFHEMENKLSSKS